MRWSEVYFKCFFCWFNADFAGLGQDISASSPVFALQASQFVHGVINSIWRERASGKLLFFSVLPRTAFFIRSIFASLRIDRIRDMKAALSPAPLSTTLNLPISSEDLCYDTPTWLCWTHPRRCGNSRVWGRFAAREWKRAAQRETSAGVMSAATGPLMMLATRAIPGSRCR